VHTPRLDTDRGQGADKPPSGPAKTSPKTSPKRSPKTSPSGGGKELGAGRQGQGQGQGQGASTRRGSSGSRPPLPLDDSVTFAAVPSKGCLVTAPPQASPHRLSRHVQWGGESMRLLTPQLPVGDEVDELLTGPLGAPRTGVTQKQNAFASVGVGGWSQVRVGSC
jgi:hypothetical protein